MSDDIFSSADGERNLLDGRYKTLLKGHQEARAFIKDRENSEYLKGFDRKDNDLAIQAKQDNQGYVFVTKPFCNLTTGNIMRNRRLLWLGDTNPLSMASAIRCSLMPDPDMHDVVSLASGSLNLPRSAFVDDFMPFIPILSSSMTSLTGWPDRVTEFFQTDEGIAKEVHFHVDNRKDQYGTFDLTATFQARDGDFINGFMQCLWEYQSAVSEGTMTPFPKLLTQREIDYNLRFYRLVLDPSKRYVRKIACCGAAVLGADTAGSDFNYTSETIVTQDNNEISVPFKCSGVWYNDPMVIKCFNETVIAYNPSMRGTDADREKNFKKLSEYEKLRYMQGIPYIGDDYELQWWVPTLVYNAMVSGEYE